MRYASVKNWDQFQHYKDRSPPWLKLHRGLLDDFEFQCLPIASRALAPMLWLLASEYAGGKFRCDPEFLAFRLRWPLADVEQGLTPLIEKGFLILDSEVLAERLQDATPERETEREKSSCASASADAPASDRVPFQQIVDTYNATMTGLAKVRELTTKRKTLIRSAWAASPQRRSVPFWEAYFAECQDDDFLNGTGPYREPHVNWRPTFDYLLRADVVTKVFERAMDRMERGQ